MEFDDRLGYLALGCLIGFVLGYIVRSLKKIEDTVKEVDDIVKHLELEVTGTVQHNVTKTEPEDVIEQIEAKSKEKDERGAITANGLFMNLALFTVIVLTVWAAFASQRASDEVEETQQAVEKVTVCNKQYVADVIEALNARTVFTQEELKASADLQKKLLDYFNRNLGRSSDAAIERARNVYSDASRKFIRKNEQAEKEFAKFPFPPGTSIEECLSKTQEILDE